MTIKCKLGKNSRKSENHRKIKEFENRMVEYIDRKWKNRQDTIENLCYSTDKETNKRKKRRA